MVALLLKNGAKCNETDRVGFFVVFIRHLRPFSDRADAAALGRILRPGGGIVPRSIRVLCAVLFALVLSCRSQVAKLLLDTKASIVWTASKVRPLLLLCEALFRGAE